MVVEVILEPIINDFSVQGYDGFIAALEARAQESWTCKLWQDCLVYRVKAMMPYFFAAGHQNYARSGLVYLRAIENLILPYFLKGKHVMRHMIILWNGIWSGMFIESTFMRYGHGRQGIIGITLKPETLKTWALSCHICSQLMEDLAELRSESNDNRFQDSHKEEATARVYRDKNDREALKSKLEMCIHPLKPELHSKQIGKWHTWSITGQCRPASQHWPWPLA